MIAIAIVGSVIAALDVFSHSEVAAMLDHDVAEHVRKTHGHFKKLHHKLWHKHHKGEKDHGIHA